MPYRRACFAAAALLLAVTAPDCRAQQPDLPEAPQPASTAHHAQPAAPLRPFLDLPTHAAVLPLSPAQKLELAFRSAVSPMSFGTALIDAGWDEVQGDYKSLGWGPEGFGKRAGAAYLKSFDRTMIGRGVLPVLLHQEPRYLRLGRGSTSRRALYAAAATVLCRHDNSMRWEPNYSNIGGAVAANALADLYISDNSSSWSNSILKSLTSVAAGSLRTLYYEFQPDLARHFRRNRAASDSSQPAVEPTPAPLP